MPLYQSSFYPDLSSVIFYDDFLGAAYNSRLWSLTTSGGGSVAVLNSLGGVVRVQAAATKLCRMNHGNNGGYSVANKSRVGWYGLMTPAVAAGGLVQCGFQSVVNPTTEYLAWHYEPNASANFRCYCVSGGVTNNQDSLVAGDGVNHLFYIECVPGSVYFFLDGVLRKTLIANITADALQPFVNCNGSADVVSNFDADWVDARGVRT